MSAEIESCSAATRRRVKSWYPAQPSPCHKFAHTGCFMHKLCCKPAGKRSTESRGRIKSCAPACFTTAVLKPRYKKAILRVVLVVDAAVARVPAGSWSRRLCINSAKPGIRMRLMPPSIPGFDLQTVCLRLGRESVQSAQTVMQLFVTTVAWTRCICRCRSACGDEDLYFP